MKILDATNLTVAQTKRYNEIFEEIADEYTFFVDDLSRRYTNDIYWWTTAFASRNIYLSDTQRKVARLLLIIEEVENNNYEGCIVPDGSFQEVLRKVFSEKEIKCKLIGNKKTRSNKMRVLKAVLCFVVTRYRIRKWINKYRKIDNVFNDEFVLIQTDVFSSNFESGKYVARDFFQIESYTTRKLVFFPYFFINNPWNIRKMIKACCEDESRFLFREDFLGFSDYIKLLGVFKNYKRYSATKKIFKGIDITEFVNNDLWRSAVSENTYYGIIDNYVVKNMRSRGLDPALFVGWYEGQPSSLGWFAAIRNSYPQKRSIGYMGYALDEKWIQLAPSGEQIKQKVVPNRITVIGEGFIGGVRRYDPNYDVVVAPAFRLDYRKYVRERNSLHDGNRVLIVLPHDRDGCRCVLDMINKTKFKNGHFFVVRNHPTNRGKRVEDYGLQGLSFAYEVIDSNSFEEALEGCWFAVMYSETTAGLETILIGVPIVYVMGKNTIHATGNPRDWNGRYYYEAYDPEQLDKAVLALKKNYVPIADGERYLVTPTRVNVSEMLALD